MFALAARTGWGLQPAEDLLEPGPGVTALGGRAVSVTRAYNRLPRSREIITILGLTKIRTFRVTT